MRPYRVHAAIPDLFLIRTESELGTLTMDSQDSNMNDAICAVAILLYGDALETEQASALLDLSPTRTRNRGEVRTTSSGAQVLQKIGFWEHRVRVPVGDLSATIVQLVDAFQCETVIGRFGIEKAELDIFVPLNPEDERNGFEMELPSGLLQKLAMLGVDVLVTTRIVT